MAHSETVTAQAGQTESLCVCMDMNVCKCQSAQYLLQMNVLVDDRLVPLWIHGLLGVPGPPLVISTDKSGY